MEPILKELKDNFYKWVIPITNKIVKNLSTLNESSLNQGYKDLGEEIYKAELDNSINYSEDKQNFLFDKLKTQEHQTSTLINILDNLPSNTIKEQYQYFDKLEYYTQYYRNLTPSNMSVERIGDTIEISGIQQSLMENATYSSNINIKQEIAKLTKHMLDQGKNILPLPKLVLRNGDKENAGEFLGKTAYYDPNTMEIVLYTEGRHPKDIVRSFAHEMVHHIQNLEDRLGNISTTNTTEDDHLDRIEQEAYLDGNMTFRNWTDSLNENLSPFSKKIEECILSDIKEYGDIDEYKIDLENTYPHHQTGNFYQFQDEVNNIDIISKLKPLPKGMVEFKFYPIKDGKPLGFIKLPQPNPKIMNTIFKIFTDEILPNNQKILIQPSDYTRYRLFRAMLNNNLDGNQYRIDTKDDPIDQSVLLVQKLDNLNENIFLEQEDELTSEVINPDGDTFRYDEISKELFTYKDSLDNLYFARIVYQPTNNPHFEFKVGWFENNNIKTPKYDPQLPPNSTAIDNIKRRNTVAKIYRDEILPFFKENQNYSNILLFKPISNSRFIFSKRLIQNHTPSDFKIKIGDDCIEIYNIKDIKERKKDPFGLNQYARELAQGLEEQLVMEGRYDALSSKLASISLNLVKKAYEKSSKTKLGKYLDKKIYYKQGETPPDIQSKEQKTILFLSIPEDLPGNFQKPIEESFYFMVKVQFV